MTTHIAFRAEQILAEQYGLTPHEVMRALRWARSAKLAAGRKDARDRGEERKRNSSHRPKYAAEPAIPPIRKEHPRVWCGQCERNVFVAEAERCSSKWCKAKASTEVTPVSHTENDGRQSVFSAPAGA